MKDATPIVKDIVLLGGGHAHVQVLRRFGMKPLPGVRLTMICRDVHTPYSGMLPGLVAGHYSFDETHIDLQRLSRFAGARFYADSAVDIDTATRRVICARRPDVPYDLLSINTGSAPNTADVPGASEHAIPVKPIDQFLGRWRQLEARLASSEGRQRVAVVGGGAGGVELTLCVRHRLRTSLGAQAAGRIELHLIPGRERVMHMHGEAASATFERVLSERDVTVHDGREVARVTAVGLHLDDGTSLDVDTTLWVTSAGAPAWLARTGIEVDEHGFIAVHPTLESVSHAGVFAAGDIASVARHPRPKAGVFAVRQGPPLAANLRRAARGQSLEPFTPQRQFLSLVSTGDKNAVGLRNGRAIEGRWLWRWKDWIDRRFMRRFDELPEMDEETGEQVARGVADADALREISAIAMRCGGCGAKVGANVLSRAIAALEPVERDDVLVGLHAPDDAAVVEVPPGKVLVHTVDAFRAFIDDPYVFGRIAANHALGDIYAMGAEPQTALAVASLPYGLEQQVERTLEGLMSGALEVLNEAGCALVGGHTSEGAELSLGFALNGLADRDQVMHKGALRAGEVLILTKPLGTGALFAADMRAKARGRWVQAALEQMQVSNREGARIVYAHGARACTDVTGFGLLGHLVEMTKPSGVDATLCLGALPVLEGALELMRLGIMSSLQPQNVRLRRAIKDLDTVSQDDRFPILFDPQTAGGLLAAVPADRAQACIDALREAGYAHASAIGEVLAEGDVVEAIRIDTRTGELPLVQSGPAVASRRDSSVADVSAATAD